MYIYQDSFSKIFTPLYFIFLLLVCSFFILNLTVAIMLNKYEEISNSEGNEDKISELIDLGQQAGLPNEVTEFIIIQNITGKRF